MSQARITLRPPPNVEFVEGYPGIPAGPERPHAEVRGTIELRLPAQGTKTKWVRVELKKVETLPGGGQNNTFFDFVGQSPVKVWEADGSEWALLRTTDFPFAIRIPESVPPSISLDRGAGIKYELTATICSKGKSKFFFFKQKDAITNTSHPIIIDKHELHSTWPVYSQPESRHVMEDMLVLTVERAGTCFGPGDRVRVVVSFKNDGIPAASLKAFEFLLKETIIFRGGPHMSGKKAAPQVQVTPIGEQKIPVNTTIYQGQSHRAELGCFIPQTHTNTSISSARHLDISYCIFVKAVLATGKPLTMELPVTVSNWPRNMSVEAVRRIGPSPALSLIHLPADPQPVSKTMGIGRSNVQSQYNQQPAYNTAPSRVGLYEENLPQKNDRPTNYFSATQTASSIGDPIVASRPGFDEFGATASTRNEGIRRPGPVNATQRRLTLMNAESDPEPDSPPTVGAPSPKKFISAFEEKKLMRAAMEDGAGSSGNAPVSPVLASSPQGSHTSSRRGAWPSAEDEKLRLYDNAKQQALKTQAIMSGVMGPIPSSMASGRPVSPPDTSIPPQPESPPAKKTSTPWPTAEEEKLKLYNAAQNAARRTQAQGMAEYVGGSRNSGGSPPASQTTFNERPTSSQSSGQAGSAYPGAASQVPVAKSTGAQLYQDAMASVNKNQPAQSSAYPTQQVTPPKPATRSYPSAEQEKAAMRYYEAKRAVDRHQQHGEDDEDNTQDNPSAEGPIAYDDLYPNAPSMQPPPVSPPIIQGPSMINNALSEKERLRRKYEAEDAAAAATNMAAAAPPPPSPPARATGSGASPPGYVSSPPPPRSQPRPPADFGGQRHLTAAEEKARLKAQMEAEDAMANGNFNPPPLNMSSLSRSASSSRAPYNPPPDFVAPPLPPPPLAPRPPAEYIQQTQEEDARSQVEHGSYSQVPAVAAINTNGNSSRLEFGLPFRPFSPLDLGVNFDQINRTPNLRAGEIPPPPPLPPKFPITLQ